MVDRGRGATRDQHVCGFDPVRGDLVVDWIIVGELGDEYTESEARINRIFDRLEQRIGAIIMTSAEDAVTKATDQLEKAFGEVSSAVTELNAVIAELREQSVSDATVERLEGVSQRLDDLNPDAPAEPPVEPPTP